MGDTAYVEKKRVEQAGAGLCELSREAVLRIDRAMSDAAMYYIQGYYAEYYALAQDAFYEIAKKYGIAAQRIGIEMLEDMHVNVTEIKPVLSGSNAAGVIRKAFDDNTIWLGTNARGEKMGRKMRDAALEDAWRVGEGMTRRQVMAAMDNAVKRGYRRTVMDNGEGFARVPSGSYTCPFCVMLASRGFVYRSSASAGEMSRFHAYCDCVVVPESRAYKAIIEGYDPAALYRLYKGGRDGTGSGAIGENTRGKTALGADGKTIVPETPKGIVQVAELFRGSKTDGPIDAEAALAGTNPNYPQGGGYATNCANSVMAYELRRRGYNVEALPSDNAQGAWGADGFLRGNGESIGDVRSWDGYGLSRQDAINGLAGMKDGSRSVVYFNSNAQGFAHVCIAERVDGKTVFLDVQSGKTVKDGFFGLGDEGSFAFVRIDNKKIDVGYDWEKAVKTNDD